MTPSAPAAPHASAAEIAAIVADLRALGEALASAADRARSLDDEEALHDVRVTARRIASRLAIWRPLLRGRVRRELVRRLRRLRRALGPVRDAEVHLAAWNARLAGESPRLRAATHSLVRQLMRRVARGRQRAAQRLSHARMQHLLARLEAVRERASSRAAEFADATDAARSRIARRRHSAWAALDAAAAHPHDEDLHAARLLLKRWRYGEEAVAAAGGREPAPRSPDLRRLQRWLGDAHDLETMVTRASAEADRLRRHGRPGPAMLLGRTCAAMERERLVHVTSFVEAWRDSRGTLAAGPADREPRRRPPRRGLSRASAGR